MEKSVEDLEEEWNNGDQKRKIEWNFRIWMLSLIDIYVAHIEANDLRLFN
jgi:hypothetical protein